MTNYSQIIIKYYKKIYIEEPDVFFQFNNFFKGNNKTHEISFDLVGNDSENSDYSNVTIKQFLFVTYERSHYANSEFFENL